MWRSQRSGSGGPVGRLRDNADPMFFVMRFFLELSPAVCPKMQLQATFLSRCLPGLRGLRGQGGLGERQGAGREVQGNDKTDRNDKGDAFASFHEAELVPTRVCR